MKKLALFLLLSTLAAATTLDLETGKFVSGTVTPESSPFAVTIQGSQDTITLAAPMLIPDGPCFQAQYTCWSFSQGVVTVESADGKLVFSDSLKAGAVIAKGNFTVVIGILQGSKGDPLKGETVFDFNSQGGKITSGHANVIAAGGAAVAPEPAGLGMMGIGVLGLAGLANFLGGRKKNHELAGKSTDNSPVPAAREQV
jgi:hypothetical protein